MHSFHTLITQNWMNRGVFCWVLFKMFTSGLRMKIKSAIWNKMYSKNYSYLKIGQWRGLWAAEGGLDSALVTGVQSHSWVWSLWDQYSATPQICRFTFSQNLNARLEYILKAIILRGISSELVVRRALSLDSAMHLTTSLAWNVHSDFLDKAYYTAKTTECQVPLERNRPAVWQG